MGDGLKPPSPWRPETDLLRLAVLGKLLEELGECTAIVSRCLIQGIDEGDPETFVPNRTSLEKEIADVRMAIRHAEEHFSLVRLRGREDTKYAHKKAWHDMIRRGEV